MDGVRRAESSVEELILGKIRTFFKFDQAKFSSSGREDVDVRMLGKGRPFMFEITNPRKARFERGELDQMQKCINEATNDVKVRDLQIVKKYVSLYRVSYAAPHNYGQLFNLYVMCASGPKPSI